MKQAIFTLTLLLLTLLPAAAAKKIEANPINIAATLVEKTDSAKVASTLEYYGYQPQGSENGYQIMRTSSGSEIRFSFSEDGVRSKYPTIIVKNTESQKSLDDRLRQMDFEKAGNSYEKRKSQISKIKTKCSHGSHSTLIFRQITK